MRPVIKLFDSQLVQNSGVLETSNGIPVCNQFIFVEMIFFLIKKVIQPPAARRQLTVSPSLLDLTCRRVKEPTLWDNPVIGNKKKS